MHVNVSFDPTTAYGHASRLEVAGFERAWVTETNRNPFVRLTQAALETTSLELATGVAIAFARSPMTLAQSAHDVHHLGGGRFTLGLGTQVRARVTRRFSMPWSPPVARMRDYVLALRSIWASWNDDVALNYQSEFYSHTLMSPVFNPGPSGFGAPKIVLGGVGERMTEMVGEVGDGFLCGQLSIESIIALLLSWCGWGSLPNSSARRVLLKP